MRFIPSYLKLSRNELKEKVRQAVKILKSCTLCPRECRVDRTVGETGFCNTGDKPYVSSFSPHFGDLVIDERGIAQRGLLVRHLVLPEGKAGTEEVVRFLAKEISPDTYTNIMAQYYPCCRAQEHHPLDRKITNKEYRHSIKAARKAGLKRLD